jgi:hypothetical protein
VTVDRSSLLLSSAHNFIGRIELEVEEVHFVVKIDV